MNGWLTHCKKGHELTPENTAPWGRALRRDGSPKRRCRRCAKEYSAATEQTRGLEKYGLTQASFAQLLEEQGGCCACCGATQANKKWSRLCIDHDHVTGKVRGLLCGNCNAGIGLFSNDPDALERAADYLRGARLAKRGG